MASSPHRRRRAARSGSLVLRISLSESAPEIWRSVQVSKTASLHQLHRIIQTVFSWTDYHLHAFRLGERVLHPPELEGEGEDSTRIRLGDLDLEAGDRFEYVYDLGDDWLHEIQVVEGSTDDEDSLPWLIGGERAGPPEDCGGMPMYLDLIRLRATALRGDALNEDEVESLEGLPDGFDPDEFSVPAARHALTLMGVWGALG